MADSKKDNWWDNWSWRQIQTNLREIDMADISAERYAEDLVKFKATVAMINTSGIIASYPTRLPFHFQSPFLTGDSLAQIIEACHARDIRVVARTDFSKVRRPLYETHPEWAYVSPKGEIVDYNGDVHACICGDYQQHYALKIIEETISTLDVDGIFFNMGGFQTRDYSGNRYGICHCESCNRRFKEMFNLSLPSDENFDDPSYRKYLVFKRTVERELKDRIAKRIHSLRPDVCIDKAYSLGSGFIRQESNTAVDRPLPNWQFSGSDNTKWAVSSYPAFVSTNTTVDFVDIPYRHVAVAPDQQRLRLYQNLANGGSLDYYLIGRLDNHEDRSGFAAVKEVFHFHARNEEHFKGLVSDATIAILDDHAGNVQEFRGWFRALAENHFVFDSLTVSAAQEVAFDKYRLMIVPDVEAISAELATKIDGFVESGGTVIASSRAAFRDDSYEEREVPGLKSLGIDRVLDVRPNMRSAYFKISDKKTFPRFEDTDLVYLDGRYIYAQYNDSVERHGRLIPPHNYGPPERCYYETVTENPAFTTRAYGSGRAIYIPWECGSLFARHGHRNSADLMADIVQHVAGTEPIGGNLSAMAEVTLFRNVERGYRLLQIVNASGHFGVTYYPPVTLHDVEISLPSSVEVHEAIGLQNGDRYEVRAKAGKTSVVVPKIEMYEAIRLS